jgi:hypothetical protein
MKTIEVKGKKKDVAMLADGVAMTTTKSGTNQYYIRCSVLGQWDFRHQQAFDNLLKKYKLEDISKNTVSNAGKRKLNGEATPITEKKVKAQEVAETENTTRGWSASAERGDEPIDWSDFDVVWEDTE